MTSYPHIPSLVLPSSCYKSRHFLGFRAFDIATLFVPQTHPQHPHHPHSSRSFPLTCGITRGGPITNRPTHSGAISLMTPYRAPARLSAYQRLRRSRSDSTGLDYSTCHRVSEDILTHIHSLLALRNIPSSPPSPQTFDERLNHLYSVDNEAVEGFNFSAARNVTNIARLETGRLSLSGEISPRLRSRNQISNMDTQIFRGQTEPSIAIPETTTLRKTRSENDPNTAADQLQFMQRCFSNLITHLKTLTKHFNSFSWFQKTRMRI
jgi:hypothetical protein